ncbi:hypothetical protein SPI_04238 [Niveomyces insectorum RCEF 264]|uniref:Uncharacterized protein n=1 Tax=Niveomyces insectorum RCEF 264 TaxID=1081102 RepID=A0A167VJQ8_9HYPO|nr:hypothetical protein SPI_04238 [Niveomyces insectorum RCEF 264]
MFEAFYPHPEDRLQLRLHRARSVVLTPEELVEIRAAQRTFEGAYMRTALSQFSFALVVLKIFTSEFYAIGALFAVYGAAVMLVAIYRRYEGNRQFFSTNEEVKEVVPTEYEEESESENEGYDHHHHHQHHHHNDQPSPGRGHRRTYTHIVVTKKFRTSGNSVALLSLLSLTAYAVLLVLLWRLHD